MHRALAGLIYIAVIVAVAVTDGMTVRADARRQAPATEPPQQEEGPRALGPGESCLAPGVGEGRLNKALGRIHIEIAENSYSSAEIRLHGLQTVTESALWTLVAGGPARPLTTSEGAAFLARLEETGLFSDISGTLRANGGTAVLDIALKEHPVVQRVVIEGLAESRQDELLKALVAVATADDGEWDDAAEKPAAGKKSKGKEALKPAGDGQRCPPPVPPREWLARVEDKAFQPGIVWQGPAAGIQRVLGRLYGAGYLMVAADGRLDPSGVLTLTIDEGRIDSVEIQGVHERLVKDVRKELKLEPGRVFLNADMESAFKRVEERFPVLQPDTTPRLTRSVPGVEEEKTPEGGAAFHTIERPASRMNTALHVERGTAVLHFHPRRGEISLFAEGLELVHHTAVGGWAPGVSLRHRLWDAQNRAHLTLVANANVHAAGGTGGHRTEWTFGPRLSIPPLSIAELGFQFEDFSDTSDRWRIDRQNSYLDSLFGSGKRTDYFRRRGFSAFATAHVSDRLTAGIEYRHDRYGAQGAALDGPRVGSMLFRGEWSSTPRLAHRMNSVRRNPETSLFDVEENSSLVTGFQTVSTVEVARPSLGSDAGIDYTRVVSDSVLTLAASSKHGLGFGRASGAGATCPRSARRGWEAGRRCAAIASRSCAATCRSWA